MINEKMLEMLCLNAILDDRFRANNMSDDEFCSLYNRWKKLTDEFINEYKLPSPINNPLKDS